MHHNQEYSQNLSFFQSRLSTPGALKFRKMATKVDTYNIPTRTSRLFKRKSKYLSCFFSLCGSGDPKNVIRKCFATYNYFAESKN